MNYWSQLSTAAPTADPLRGDDTLSLISDFANDVEMLEASSGDSTNFLVIDTNVLIDHLDVLWAFSEDMITSHIEINLLIVIPNVVLSELDGLKNRSGLAWFARRASTLLLEKIKEKKNIKVQARTEIADTELDEHQFAHINDVKIYDCCRYFQTKGNVCLLSADNNLCITCEKDDITTTSPPKHRWSSRDLAKALFGDHVDLNKFRGQETNPKYRPAKSTVLLGRTDIQQTPSMDGMDIDDGMTGSTGDTSEEFIPSHALDDLHRQVINHFTIVLRELAERVLRASGENVAPTRSIHAAGYRRKPLELWTAQNCLEYLGTKTKLKPSTPPLTIFLLRRNEDRGWRRGQDWTRQNWKNALDALDDLGQQFRDAVVLNSLAELRRHVHAIFESPMRPTGT